MIKRILVAVDGSEPAERAVDLAASLAGKYGADVLLLHVASERQVPEGFMRFAEAERVAGPPAYAYHKMVAERIMAESAKRARDQGAALVDTLVLAGDPAKEIIATAKGKGADLIVMGSRGLSDLEGLLMGSVAHKVSHLAPCNCITVK